MKNKNFLKIYLNKKKIMRQGGEKTSTLLREIIWKKNKVKIGLHTYGGCFSDEFNLGGQVEIGRYCSVGPNVHYFGANHPMNYASMSPYFYQKSWGGESVTDIQRHKLVVGNDCWIGASSIITCNCKKIGNGAVIGAGAVVTKDVEPYSIVAGNPARVIKYRFDEETITLLEKSKWYDLEPDTLLKFYEYIDSPKVFAEKIMQYMHNNT